MFYWCCCMEISWLMNSSRDNMPGPLSLMPRLAILKVGLSQRLSVATRRAFRRSSLCVTQCVAILLLLPAPSTHLTVSASRSHYIADSRRPKVQVPKVPKWAPKAKDSRFILELPTAHSQHKHSHSAMATSTYRYSDNYFRSGGMRDACTRGD